MQYLYKIFRFHEHSYFEKKYNERFHMDSTIKFNLYIKPMKQPNKFQLYYVPTNDIIKKIIDIYQISGQLDLILNKLPPVAKNQFVSECLLEELYHTNQLEGVQSTKKEIAESIRSVRLKKESKTRFNSMINSYFSLLDKEVSLPTNPADIREIYDEITEGEIEKSELPDGDIFRKESVSVLKKSGSGKVIHRGVVPESKIIEEIERLLDMLNNLEEVPMIVRVAVGHYYFGYIHPFYDGNGRTSRFISSLYLSKTLGEIQSLSLSRGCNKFKGKYLDAFEDSNSIMNRGEMNSFIDTFLTIILETLKEMNAELKEKVELMDIAIEKIKNDKNIPSEKHSSLMFILAQNNFFSNNEGLTVKELAQVMELSEATVRKIGKDLIDRSLIKQRGIRPALYYIDDEYFEH